MLRKKSTFIYLKEGISIIIIPSILIGCNPLGGGQTHSVIPDTFRPGVLVSAPSTVSSLAATASTSSISLTWSAPSTLGGSVVSYDVQRSTVSGGPYVSLASGLSDLSFVDSTPVIGTTYYYIVIASNATGTQASSEIKSSIPTPTSTPSAAPPLSSPATVSITTPASNAIPTNPGTSFTVSGACSENSRTVSLSATDGTTTVGPATPTCTSGAWTTTLNLSSLAQGTITLTATHQDAALNTPGSATRTLIKDTIPATVSITTPASNAVATNPGASFTVSGACSENSRTVSLTASAGGSTVGPATPTCTSGAWTTTLNLSTLAQGTVTLTATHQDAALNTAGSATRTLVKDTIPATVSITTPASNAVATNPSNPFTVSGACSENSRTVSLSASAGGSTVGPATPTCTSGAWTTTLNLSTLGETTVTLTATHQDAALNTPGSATRTLIKDTTTPSVTFKTNGASVVSKTFPLNVSSPENLPLVQGTPAATLTFSATHATSPSSSFTSCTFETLGLSVSDPAYTTATACSSLPSITTTNSVPVTGTATYSTTPGATASATISNWTPTYQQHGTYLFKLTATDGVNPTTQSFFVTVRENFTITQLLAGYDPLSATSATGLATTVPSAPFASGASNTSWLNFAPTTSNATLAGGAGWLGTGQNSTSSVDPYRYSFNGTTEKMTLGTNLGASVTKFAINTWIKPSSPTTTGSIIASNGGITGNGFALRQSVASPGKAEFIIGTPTFYSYQDLILSDAPVTYLRFNDATGSGNATDLSAYGNTGLYQSSPTLQQSGAISGDTDHSVTLDGSSQYITTSNSVSNPQVFSLEVWFKTTNGYAAGGKIVSFGQSQTGSSNSNDRQIWMDNTGKINLGVYTNTTVVLTSPLSYNDGNWHHTVGTYISTGMILYVDGQAISSITNLGAAPNYTGYWRFGYDNLSGWSNQPTSSYFQGSLDEGAIYNYVLTPSQISNHYHTGLADSQKLSYPANPVLADKPAAYWRLGESSGTTAKDSSGNGVNGTYSGGYTLAQSGALTGDPDTATTFDGSSGNVSVGSSPISNNNASVELWAYVPAASSHGAFIKVGGNTDLGYAIGIGDNNNFQGSGHYLMVLAENVAWWYPNITMNSGWNHIVLVLKNNNTQALYLNGATTPASTNTISIAAPAASILIGGYSNDGNGAVARMFAGKLDEVSIYTYPLSPTQVHKHFTSSAWMATSCQTQTTLSNNNWNLLSALYDGSTAQLFVNGQSECSFPTTGYAGGVATPTIGASPTSTNFWQGALGLFNIFGTTDGVTSPATATTIKNDFDAQANRFRATPVENLVKSGLVFSVDAANAQQGLSPFTDNSCQGLSLTWSDLSTSGFNGTLSNFGNGTNCTAASGWSGTGSVASPYALVFNNGTNNVKINSNITGNSTSVTLTAWYNPLNRADGTNLFWNKGDHAYNGSGYYFQINSSTGLLGIMDTAGTYWTSNLAMVANTWQHIAFTITGTTGNTYLNGVAASGTGTIAAITPNTESLSYLMYNGATYGNSGAGSVSTLQIYNRLLSTAEIKQNCLAQEHRFTATPQSICAAP